MTPKQTKKSKDLKYPEGPCTRPMSPGVAVVFPVKKGASPNEVCDVCGCHCMKSGGKNCCGCDDNPCKY